MKCKRCRAAVAAVELASHNTAFCPSCFFVYFRGQVEEGIRKYALLAKEDRVLVCVSGGKDSLVLWDILLDLGYDAEGLHIDLGIEGYSARSRAKVEAYAASRGRRPIIIDLSAEGLAVSLAAVAAKKPECAVCGTIKRHFFNRVAAEQGFGVVATGHNLDDEAARLLGNVLHWHRNHLARQHPLLEERGDGFVRKVKPLWRVSEYESAAYGFLKAIDFVIEECPMSVDATSLLYKEVLSLVEEKMPGTRAGFYFDFLKDKAASPASSATQAPLRKAALPEPRPCSSCGWPCFGETCSVCRLRQKVKERLAKQARRTPA